MQHLHAFWFLFICGACAGGKAMQRACSVSYYRWRRMWPIECSKRRLAFPHINAIALTLQSSKSIKASKQWSFISVFVVRLYLIAEVCLQHVPFSVALLITLSGKRRSANIHNESPSPGPEKMCATHPGSGLQCRPGSAGWSRRPVRGLHIVYNEPVPT